MTKLRLDQLLLDRGLAESKTKAQALILSGNVYTENRKLDKPGMQVASDIIVKLKEQEHPWVSRGGMKLAKAIEHFSLDVKDSIAIDVGASTGGFTDVLLHHGAAKVYAIDVGHGQLAWSLRNDDRVVVYEKTNARHLCDEQIEQSVDWVVCDASFIGLQKVLPASLSFVKAGGGLVSLIKPQFEVGKEQVGKGGVVRDPELHEQVCAAIEEWLNHLDGWSVQGIIESPITGPKGNKEFLIYARFKGE